MTYPELRAKDADNGADYSTINAAIKRAAEQYKDSYADFTDSVTTSGYVTYMDDEKISVVFQEETDE